MHDKLARTSTFDQLGALAQKAVKACACLIVLSIPIGCAETGDFGRKPYSVLDDKIIPTVAKGVAQTREQPVSWFRYTEAEKNLRNEAEKLVTPYGRHVFLERSIRRVERANLVSNRVDWNSPERYTARLDREKFDSGRSRVRTIMSHMQDDGHFMLRFEKAMVKVLRADRSRAEHLRINRDYPPAERANARNRIKENRAVMAETISIMNRRIDAYDEALHITPLRFPGTGMGPARKLLLDLEDYTKSLAQRLG